MFSSTIRQRSFISAIFILSMMIFFPLNGLSNSAFAQTKLTSQCPPKKLCSLTPASHPYSGGSSSVTLNPSEAPAGAAVTGVGSNWNPGDSMLVQWDDGTNLATTTVQSDGTFSVPFTVPSNAGQGSHTVYFTDQSAGYFIPATLTVGTCASTSLSVQSVFTEDGNGNSTTIFAPGNAIRYAVYVNNSCGSTINATFHFEDFWGTINDGPIQIFDYIFQNITLPLGQSGWYTQWTVPANALPGPYTDHVFVWDQNNYPNQGSGNNPFAVTGNVNLSVPYYKQFWPKNPSYKQDCGPTSVAMVLSYYKKGPGGDAQQKIAAIRAVIEKDFPDGNKVDGTKGKELEDALSHYGSSFSEISQNIPNLSNPDAQLTDIAAAIEQGMPVIVFVNAHDLGRRYLGHWLVVTGFASDGTNNQVLVNDPDSDFSGGHPIITLTELGNAIIDGRTHEPNNIAGIIVTS